MPDSSNFNNGGVCLLACLLIALLAAFQQAVNIWAESGRISEDCTHWVQNPPKESRK